MDDIKSELSEELLNDYPAAQLREIGMSYFLNSAGDSEKRRYGLDLLLKAFKMKDPIATYFIAKLTFDGYLKFQVENQAEHALMLMCNAANEGCVQARAFLNAYCEARYRKNFSNVLDIPSSGPLVDFEGKPIKINKQGLFTPIDALLEYKDGKNILTLSTNVMFVYNAVVENSKKFEQAVKKGILAWQGDYEVFGGQKLTVNVKLTKNDSLFDHLFIAVPDDDYFSLMKKISNLLASKKKKSQIESLVNDKRSFATSGLKWTTNSPKVIFLQSEDGLFEDYEEIENVAKHEFGHALGIGDLYSSSVDSLQGVVKGTYTELDSYAISDKYYNLVMCDHHGPISNNDIEMVILAYMQNKMQLFQPSEIKGKISTALGRGN